MSTRCIYCGADADHVWRAQDLYNVLITPPENSSNYEGKYAIKKNMSRETWDKLIKSVSPPSQPIASPIVISLLVIFTVLAAYFFFFVAVPAHPPRKSGALFILLICIAVTLAWEWSAKKRTPAYETAFQKYLRRMICTKCWQISS